jgi:Cu2+-exporting ATPase
LKNPQKAEESRPNIERGIDALKALNICCMMFTGDNKATAKWVSDQIGLDEYFAEVLPQDKAAKVKEVQARGVSVAMIGDGVNNAPALAQSDLGVAIGAGSNVAVESADVILVRSYPLDVRFNPVGILHVSPGLAMQELMSAKPENIWASAIFSVLL